MNIEHLSVDINHFGYLRFLKKWEIWKITAPDEILLSIRMIEHTGTTATAASTAYNTENKPQL